jgi:hypothetical protein
MAFRCTSQKKRYPLQGEQGQPRSLFEHRVDQKEGTPFEFGLSSITALANTEGLETI